MLECHSASICRVPGLGSVQEFVYSIGVSKTSAVLLDYTPQYFSLYFYFFWGGGVGSIVLFGVYPHWDWDFTTVLYGEVLRLFLSLLLSEVSRFEPWTYLAAVRRANE